jgi:hypothetical protein
MESIINTFEHHPYVDRTLNIEEDSYIKINDMFSPTSSLEERKRFATV